MQRTPKASRKPLFPSLLPLCPAPYAEGKIRYRSPDKTAAREQAMKHFGLYGRDNKQKPFYMPPEFVIVGVPGRGK